MREVEKDGLRRYEPRLNPFCEEKKREEKRRENMRRKEKRREKKI